MDLQDNMKGIAERNDYEIGSASLGGRVRRGGVWVFTWRVLHRAASLIRIIVLARLLSPNDFGLFGIALLTLSILDTFSQTGFRQALIQKRGDTRPYLDTAWTIGVIRGISIAAVLFGIAPLVSSFFNAAQAGPILKVIGLAIVVQSLSNIAVIYFERELEFHKYFAYQFSGTVIDLIVAISAALILRSAWALVFGCLAGNLARCIASYLIDPYRPRFRLDSSKAIELFGFGKWVLGSSMLVFLLIQGDDIFVGKLLGVTMLGFYQMAYRISNMPATEYSHLIATVMFPAYSKIQDNLPRFRNAYLKVLQLTSFIAIPIAGMIFVLAPDFTILFLGEKWMPIVPAMKVLALYGMLRAIGATTGVVFMAAGKPEIITKIAGGQLILLAALIYPLTARWGITGASLAVTTYALVFNFVAVYKVLSIVEAGCKEAVKRIVPPFWATVVFVAVIFIMKNYAFPYRGYGAFLALAVLGMAVYALVMLFFDALFHCGSMLLIREQYIALLKRKDGA